MRGTIYCAHRLRRRQQSDASSHSSDSTHTRYDHLEEEVFGPVLCITPFDTEEEAIALANDTPYGLTNYVQTADKVRARRVARQLRSGMVEMNGKFGGAGSPFGGMKQSGNGREGGVWGLEEFPETKAVSDWE